MRWTAALPIPVLMVAQLASAQSIDLSILDKLAARASSSVNITLDEDKLKFASGFLSTDDPKQTSARNLVGSLKGINVRVLEFEGSGRFSNSDLDALRAQLKAPGWSKIVEARERDESAEIYMFNKGKELGGMMIIAAEKHELAVVNIVGPVDLKTLGELGGKFGIPKDVLGAAGDLAPKPPTPPKKKD